MNSALFEPANIKDLQLKNRFVRSATAEGMTTFDGCPTTELKDLYCTLAEGKVGFIITCGALIEAWKNGNQEKAKCVSCNQCFDNWIYRPLRCYAENPLKKEVSN